VVTRSGSNDISQSVLKRVQGTLARCNEARMNLETGPYGRVDEIRDSRMDGVGVTDGTRYGRWDERCARRVE
jgi:hypothetical protein